MPFYWLSLLVTIGAKKSIYLRDYFGYLPSRIRWQLSAFLSLLLPVPKVGAVECIKNMALLGLVGKMDSKIQSCWRGSGRNHKDTEDTKIDHIVS
ncbi:hypothetical protein MICAI_830003 [Microcystis sp. T1-4]|nr:hypothetical protein MICAI_830003 [Microcystis sp. T1-4]